jgi:hypothetical protein
VSSAWLKITPIAPAWETKLVKAHHRVHEHVSGMCTLPHLDHRHV